MGELGEELGRALKVAFLIVWKGLTVKTQHRLEVLGIIGIVVGFLNAVRQDLQSKSSGLKGVWREYKSLTAEGWTGIKLLCRRLCAPSNPGMIPAATLLILAAFGEWPYNFYILTRIIACPTLIWIALLIHRRRYLLWEIVILIFALIFNPIVPFHFTKSTWGMFNIVAAVAIVPAIYLRLKETPRTAIAQPEIGQVVAVPVPALKDSSDRKYKYCGRCSVRVGRSDSFCKRCGNTLQ